MICVVIGRSRPKMVETEIQEAAKRGAQLLEIRLDFLAQVPDFKRLLAHRPCPLIATVRRVEDGGKWSGTEEARQTLLRQAIASGFDWVDLETDVADAIPRFQDVKRIVSYHNLHEVPADLEEIYQRMCGQDVDVVKVAVMAQQPEDNMRVLNLLRNAPRPTVALCMGDMGTCSRILGAKFGAAYTYAVLHKDVRVALGILSLDELRHVYHYDQINAETTVYGVVGDPIGHSLSPVIHNGALRALGRNAVYVPFRVPRSQLPVFLREFDRLPVEGYSVTIPHKEAAAALAHQADAIVQQTRSANTLLRTPTGFAAFNTDAPAALESLRAILPARHASAPDPLQRRRVLLLGAGGVARSLAHALRQAGAEVLITNRTPERGQKLAAEIGGLFVPWTERNAAAWDILINCTSVGMHPNVDEMPIDRAALHVGQVVMDTVYTPENTLLVKEARQRGCYVRTGVDMFVRQAAMQFQLFTGQEPPIDLMHQLVKHALLPVTLPPAETLSEPGTLPDREPASSENC